MLPFFLPLHTDSLCTRYTTSHRIFLQQRDSNLSREVALHSSLFLLHSIPLHNLQPHPPHPPPKIHFSPLSLSLHVSLDRKNRFPNRWETVETTTFQLSTRLRLIQSSFVIRPIDPSRLVILRSLRPHSSSSTRTLRNKTSCYFGLATSEHRLLDE